MSKKVYNETSVSLEKEYFAKKQELENYKRHVDKSLPPIPQVLKGAWGSVVWAAFKLAKIAGAVAENIKVIKAGVETAVKVGVDVGAKVGEVMGNMAGAVRNVAESGYQKIQDYAHQTPENSGKDTDEEVQSIETLTGTKPEVDRLFKEVEVDYKQRMAEVKKGLNTGLAVPGENPIMDDLGGEDADDIFSLPPPK